MSALKLIDRVLAPVSWLVAALVVLALFVGPELIAAKGDAPATAKPDGAALFAESCGGCHTLSAAGSSGSTGPNLDDLAPDAETVSATVYAGAGSMPSFADSLSAGEIDAIAQYVAGSAGG